MAEPKAKPAKKEGDGLEALRAVFGDEAADDWESGFAFDDADDDEERAEFLGSELGLDGKDEDEEPEDDDFNHEPGEDEDEKEEAKPVGPGRLRKP
jgi:hypothetical protein